MYALRTASSGKEGGRESCRWREEREMEEGETERGERKEDKKQEREEERGIITLHALFSMLEY